MEKNSSYSVLELVEATPLIDLVGVFSSEEVEERICSLGIEMVFTDGNRGDITPFVGAVGKFHQEGVCTDKDLETLVLWSGETKEELCGVLTEGQLQKISFPEEADINSRYSDTNERWNEKVQEKSKWNKGVSRWEN